MNHHHHDLELSLGMLIAATVGALIWLAIIALIVAVTR